MYPTIEPPLLRRIWNIAEREQPREAVGMLCGDILPTDGTVVQYTSLIDLTNISADPTRFFALDRDEFMEAMKPRFAGKQLALWHSHVEALPKLSEEDCEVMWAIKLPMLVVSLGYSCAVLYTYGKPRHDGKRPIVQWDKWGKP